MSDCSGFSTSKHWHYITSYCIDLHPPGFRSLRHVANYTPVMASSQATNLVSLVCCYAKRISVISVYNGHLTFLPVGRLATPGLSSLDRASLPSISSYLLLGFLGIDAMALFPVPLFLRSRVQRIHQGELPAGQLRLSSTH